MSESPQRLDNLRSLAKIARLLAIIGVGGFAVIGVYLLAGDPDVFPWLGSHLPAFMILFGVLVATALCVFLWLAITLLLKIEGNGFRSYDITRDMAEAIGRQTSELRLIAENSQISDLVRSVTHRSRERTAIRLAINEEIIRGDWEAAYALVELLEERHGYRNEASRLRAELDESRENEANVKVHDTVEQVRSLMASHDWDRARRMMDRLLANNGSNHEVRELPNAFHRAWNEHKRRLLKEWDQTVQRNEVDRGIALLKELDHYLTPSEAAALQESARGVFREKLRNMGVQFSLAVSESNWKEALKVGRQIQEEFPNSRMASEVQDRIHVLVKRAREMEENGATVSSRSNGD
ncbi:MAG TPA: hypothetical protein P5081_16600 [Phycisphaerae bacterium]|nr:hypothetical protein [Phycisphaerae bacterium]HRW54491.1 hypothetical protein [Phycisphaerae bacterium]